MGKIEFDNDIMYYVDENENKEKVEFEDKYMENIFNSINGDSSLKKDFIESNKGDFPVFTGSHFIEDFINIFKVEEDCLSFNKDNGAGTKCFLHIDEKFNMNSHHFAVTLKNKKEYSIYFLYMFFNSYFIKNFYGWENPFSFQKNKKLKIKIPVRTPKISSLEIQQAISDYIEKEYSEIDEKIDTIDSMILLLKYKKELILENVFEKGEYIDENGDVVKVVFEENYNLGKYKNLIYNGDSKFELSIVENNQQNENYIPVYSGQTENNGIVGYVDKKFRKTEQIFKNKVIYTTRGAKAGTVMKINTEFTMANNVYAIDVLENTLFLNYFYYIFYKTMKEKFLKGGYGQVNQGEIYEINIKIPLETENFTSLEIQKQIINYIKKEYKDIDEKIDSLESMKLLLKYQKELILENIFKGN
jgi:restriction endonuclease S subunit